MCSRKSTDAGWRPANNCQSYHELKNDGSTDCGCWIYSGVFPGERENKADQRAPVDYLGHGWGFSWPGDVRILYNRCSARPDGKPWSERKKLVWWDEAKQEWTGLDRPDFDKKKRPDYVPPEGATGMDALRGDQPFILHPDGVGWLFVTSGLKDGPLPTHYEPLESPFRNALYPEHPTNPPVNWEKRPDNNYAYFGDERFPFVLSTYRLTEHHTAGGMSRTLSHLAELQPELFCEVSPELAADRELRTWRLCDHHHGARNHPGARAGDPAHETAVGRRPHRSSSRPTVPLGLQRRRQRRCSERSAGDLRGAERAHHGNQGTAVRHRARTATAWFRGAEAMAATSGAAGMSTTTAFLTDSTLCIGCKACEVACKEWNGLAEDGLNWTGNSYDNTSAVGHSTWRHVKFVEGFPEPGLGGNAGEQTSWGFSSDVCKHCEVAGCLEACPTGAIVRTEFGGVFVQPDVCNGCAYCVVACPFGVVQRNPQDGRAFKCTFCYDRQKVGLEPACAKACPTESIKFGSLRNFAGCGTRARRGVARARHGRCAALRSGGQQRRRPACFLHRARRSHAVQSAAESPSARYVSQGRMEEFRRSRRTAVGRQPVRLFGERKTMSTDPLERPIPERTDWSRENRLVEIRREAERTGRVTAAGVRLPGAPFPVASPETGYYGLPLLKEPAWTWEIPLYFFAGGAAGSAAVIGAVARWTGRDLELSRDCRYVAAAGTALSSALLIGDLGRPKRFLAMLRVFKRQSPMSVGAWTLAAFGTASAAAALAQLINHNFRESTFVGVGGDIAEAISALAGLPFSNYTGVLIGASVIPVWNENVASLPIHFGMSGLNSAVVDPRTDGPQQPCAEHFGHGRGGHRDD